MKITNWHKKTDKNWNVLIYANGNNDLEPEITRSLLQMEQVGCGHNSQVLVQLARAPQQLVQTLRPGLRGPTGIDCDWSGVRRYRLRTEPIQGKGLKTFNSELLSDLGSLNMADPSALGDFICWVMENFPAQYTLLVLVGHGAGFMGALTDLTSACPKIMSVDGIAAALEQSARITDRKIDVLLFDSCYMNTLEIAYELGIRSRAPKYLITPNDTPLAGIPYNVLLEIFHRHSLQPKELINQLVNELNFALAGQFCSLRLNPGLLWCIKEVFSNLAKLIMKQKIDLSYCFHTSRYSSNLAVHRLMDLLYTQSTGSYLSAHLWLMNRLLQILLMGQSQTSLNVYFPSRKDFFLMLPYYSKLRFCQNNLWVKLFSGSQDISQYLRDNKSNVPKPACFHLEGLRHIIRLHNPGLSSKEIDIIIQKLGWQDCQSLADSFKEHQKTE